MKNDDALAARIRIAQLGKVIRVNTRLCEVKGLLRDCVPELSNEGDSLLEFDKRRADEYFCWLQRHCIG